MKKRVPCLAALVAGALSACASDPGFVPVSGMREITAAEASRCTYVSDFTMTPPVYGPFATQGVRYARNRIMADAQAAGANAAVFDKVAPGAEVYQLHAAAYRC